MKNLQWHMARLWFALSPTGAGGLFLLATALVLQIGWGQSLQQQIISTKARIALAETEHKRSATQSRVAPRIDWTKQLPPATTLPALQKELNAIAEKHAILLNEGHFSVEPVAGSAMVHVSADLPFDATYSNFRGFLADALKRFPSLAVDNIELSQARPENDRLQVKLYLSAYLRGPQ